MNRLFEGVDMAKDFRPLRIVRPTAAPSSTYFDVSPLAQLTRLETSEGMQVARALSGLSPVLMSLSQTLAGKEMEQGREAAAELPRDIKDVAEANKWFDEQGLVGPFRQMAFREAIGKQLKGRQLQSALEQRRDDLIRLTDDSGNPITQADRDKIVQDTINSLDVGNDVYVRRGFNSVKDRILNQFLAENDRIIAARVREKNDLSIQFELTNSLIQSVQSGDIEAVTESVQKVSDRLRESGLDPSGRRQVYGAVDSYIRTLLSNPDTPQSELERARALVSEIMSSPEETGRPPLTPDLLASYTALEDILDERIDDPVTVTDRQVRRYEGEMYRVLSQSTGYITDAGWIDLVTETTGLPEGQAGQVAARLRPLLNQYNEKLQRGPMSPEEFNLIRSAAERGEPVPKPVLARMGPDQLASIERFIESSPYTVEGMREQVTASRSSFSAEMASVAVSRGMSSDQARYLSLLGNQKLTEAIAVNFQELQSNEDYLNSGPNERFAMANAAVDSAIDTVRSTLMESDEFQSLKRSSLENIKSGMVSVLMKEVDIFSDAMTKDMIGDPEEIYRTLSELNENGRKIAEETVSRLIEENPEATAPQLQILLDREMPGFRNELSTSVTGVRISESGSPLPSLGEQLGIQEPPRFSPDTRTLIAGDIGTAGRGFFSDTDYYNAMQDYQSVFSVFREAAESGEVTNKTLQALEESREKLQEEARTHLDSILDYDNRELQGLDRPKYYPSGSLMYGPAGVYRGGGRRSNGQGGYRPVSWTLDKERTQEYLATKGILADWDEGQLTPTRTTNNGETVYTTSEGVEFYGAGSGKFPSVNPTTHLFFKDFESLEQAYAQYVQNKTGYFAKIVELADGDEMISPDLIYVAQRKLLPIRLGAALQNTGD